MARVCKGGKGRGGMGSVSKRQRAFKAHTKQANRKLDLARKS